MRNVLIALPLVALLATATQLYAQEEPLDAVGDRAQPIPAGDDCEELRRKIAALGTELEKLKSRVDGHDNDLQRHEDALQTLAQGVLNNKEAIGNNTSSITANSGRISDNSTGITNNSRSIRSLNEGVVNLQRAVSDNDEKLRQIARYDSGSGEYILDVLGNMQKSSAFRRDVHNTTKGRVHIRNTTGGVQYVYINGVRWRVSPAEYSYAPVARGPVTMQCSRTGSRIVLNNWRHDRHGYAVAYDIAMHAELPMVPDDSPDADQDSPSFRPLASSRSFDNGRPR